MPALQNRVASDAAFQLGVLLQCPRCETNIIGLDCPLCTFRMEIDDGIVHALPPERAAHYKQFVQDYEHIRMAEGRGSENGDFYLGLPYKDISARNCRQWQIRARSYDYLVRHVLTETQQHCSRRILDIGAGNCWMSFRLALAGFQPVAVDLLTNKHDGLGAAGHFRNRLPQLFPRFQAEMGHLPFQDGQFDVIVFNASFHYSENSEAILREALRCVRSGGMVIICDTPWYSKEESGRQMVKERQAAFLRDYGTASDSIENLDYLTDDRLRSLENKLSIRWSSHSPLYGLRWAMRPLAAKLRGRREPSRFRIYVAQKSI
jgi:SAM-dependent methyltransferase